MARFGTVRLPISLNLKLYSSLSAILGGGNRLDEIEALDDAIWGDALAKLLRRAQSAPPQDLEAQIRLASHLARLAPASLPENLRPALTEGEFDDLLNAGSYMKAVEVLIEKNSSHSCLDARDGTFAAFVQMPTGGFAQSARSKVSASALLCAWLKCLVDLSATLHRQMPREPENKVRSARHLQLIEPLTCSSDSPDESPPSDR